MNCLLRLSCLCKVRAGAVSIQASWRLLSGTGDQREKLPEDIQFFRPDLLFRVFFFKFYKLEMYFFFLNLYSKEGNPTPQPRISHPYLIKLFSSGYFAPLYFLKSSTMPLHFPFLHCVLLCILACNTLVCMLRVHRSSYNPTSCSIYTECTGRLLCQKHMKI